MYVRMMGGAGLRQAVPWPLLAANLTPADWKTTTRAVPRRRRPGWPMRVHSRFCRPSSGSAGLEVMNQANG